MELRGPSIEAFLHCPLIVHGEMRVYGPWILTSIIFAWVVLAFGNTFLAINMDYFVIHALVSPITLCFSLYGF